MNHVFRTYDVCILGRQYSSTTVQVRRTPVPALVACRVSCVPGSVSIRIHSSRPLPSSSWSTEYDDMSYTHTSIQINNSIKDRGRQQSTPSTSRLLVLQQSNPSLREQ